MSSERAKSGKGGPPVNLNDDPSIPVLTEMLTLPPLEIDFTLPPAPSATGQATAPSSPVPPLGSSTVSPPTSAPTVVQDTTPSDLPTFPLDVSFDLPPLPPSPAPTVYAAPQPTAPMQPAVDSVYPAERPRPRSAEPPAPRLADPAAAGPITTMLAAAARLEASSRAATRAAPPTTVPAARSAQPTTAGTPPRAPSFQREDAASAGLSTQGPVTSGLTGPATRAPQNGGGHWARIEIDLRESILREVTQRLPQDVETIVRNELQSAIDGLVGQLAADIRRAVALSMRDLIDQAVKTELERLRGLRK